MGDDAITDRAFSGYSPHGLRDQDTYSGALSFLRRPYSKVVEGADVVVNGVPYDLAVTNRPGARLGPRAIRAASAHLAWGGGPWRWPFDPTEVLKIVDWGDMSHDHGRPERFPATLEAHMDALVATGARVLTLGGDHFISYPIMKAHAKEHGPLALVQFDSHSDTWDDGGERIDHGTMFLRGAREGVIDAEHSVQIGIRSGNPEAHGFTVVNADETIESPVADLVAKIERVTAGRPVYLSFDIDFLDPAYAPGTGTPVCGGPSSHRAERILAGLTELDIVGADVVEVSPPFDHAEITALAGATMAMNIIGLWAHRKRAAA